MANKKISELSAAGALTGTELIETVQGGVNVQTTTQAIANLSSGGLTSADIDTIAEFNSIVGDGDFATVVQLADKADAGATIVTDTGAYTLQASDLTLVNAGATLIIDGDSTDDLTVPLNATVAFPVGSFIGVRDFNNVVATGGVTITGTNGSLTVPSGMTATLEKTGTDTWILHNGAAATWGSITGTLSDQTDLQAALDLKSDSKYTIYEKTASYTLLAADLTDVNDGKILLFEMNVASANTFTVPPNATVAFPIGTVIYIDWTGAGQPTITPDTGVTFQGGRYKISEQYAGCFIKKVATNTWRVQGSLTS